MYPNNNNNKNNYDHNNNNYMMSQNRMQIQNNSQSSEQDYSLLEGLIEQSKLAEFKTSKKKKKKNNQINYNNMNSLNPINIPVNSLSNTPMNSDISKHTIYDANLTKPMHSTVNHSMNPMGNQKNIYSNMNHYTIISRPNNNSSMYNNMNISSNTNNTNVNSNDNNYNSHHTNSNNNSRYNSILVNNQMNKIKQIQYKKQLNDLHQRQKQDKQRLLKIDKDFQELVNKRKQYHDRRSKIIQQKQVQTKKINISHYQSLGKPRLSEIFVKNHIQNQQQVICNQNNNKRISQKLNINKDLNHQYNRKSNSRLSIFLSRKNQKLQIQNHDNKQNNQIQNILQSNQNTQINQNLYLNNKNNQNKSKDKVQTNKIQSKSNQNFITNIPNINNNKIINNSIINSIKNPILTNPIKDTILNSIPNSISNSNQNLNRNPIANSNSISNQNKYNQIQIIPPTISYQNNNKNINQHQINKIQNKNNKNYLNQHQIPQHNETQDQNIHQKKSQNINQNNIIKKNQIQSQKNIKITQKIQINNQQNFLKNQRITMQLNQMMNLLQKQTKQQNKQNIQKIEKIKQLNSNLNKKLQASKIPAKKQIPVNSSRVSSNNNQSNNRTTLSFQQIAQMLQAQVNKKIQLPNKPMTQIDRIIAKHIIYEDEEEDQYTPFKNTYINKQKKTFEQTIKAVNSKIRSYHNRKRQYIYMGGMLFEPLENQFQSFLQKMVYDLQELIKLKNRVGCQVKYLQYSTNKTIKRMKPKTQKLQQLKKQEMFLSNLFKQIKSKVNSKKFVQYYNTIQIFQTKLGIRLHTFRKYNQYRNYGLVPKKNSFNNFQGFFVQFSMNNLIFRIKRLEGQQFAKVRFLAYVQDQDEQCLDLKFDLPTKTSLFSKFITYRVRDCTTFTQILIQIVKYNEAIHIFQKTMSYLQILFDLKQIELNQTGDKITFEYTISEKNFKFIYTIDLLSLLQQHGGLSIYYINQQYFLNIPVQELNKNTIIFGDKENKLMSKSNRLLNSFSYIIENAFLILKEYMQSQQAV